MNFLKIVLLLCLIFTTIVGSILFVNVNKKSSISRVAMKVQEEKSNPGELIVMPQVPNGKVEVRSVMLSKNGFLVVRQMDDGKLSQIVEMSRPLKAGLNKNVEISLAGEDVSNKELIVMIYEDYGNDGIFNDLDMPALNKDGFMTASYVKTGRPLPTNITEGDSAMGMSMAGMKAMARVRYTDNGFVPDKVKVKVGDMVEFINESSTVMWVASTPHPQHTDLPTFDQFRSVKKGAIYRYVFDKKGKWGFHDHINPSRGGIVTVI